MAVGHPNVLVIKKQEEGRSVKYEVEYQGISAELRIIQVLSQRQSSNEGIWRRREQFSGTDHEISPVYNGSHLTIYL